jgi:hypothetical protein
MQKEAAELDCYGSEPNRKRQALLGWSIFRSDDSSVFNLNNLNHLSTLNWTPGGISAPRWSECGDHQLDLKSDLSCGMPNSGGLLSFAKGIESLNHGL